MSWNTARSACFIETDCCFGPLLVSFSFSRHVYMSFVPVLMRKVGTDMDVVLCGMANHDIMLPLGLFQHGMPLFLALWRTNVFLQDGLFREHENASNALGEVIPITFDRPRTARNVFANHFFFYLVCLFYIFSISIAVWQTMTSCFQTVFFSMEGSSFWSLWRTTSFSKMVCFVSISPRKEVRVDSHIDSDWQQSKTSFFL